MKTEENKFDPLLEDAANLIIKENNPSVSLLQRRMRLGYMRSFRIIDQLESLGILGPFNGTKPREILIKDKSAIIQSLK